jgi:hypothetical protein
MQIETTTTTPPAPKPDAQPVQAAYIAEDYHDARLHGSYGTAAEIAEALTSAADLSHEVKGMWLAASAKMRAKAQPVQAANFTPEPAVLRLLAALEAIHEAGRMSDQPRAVYCALIAQDALAAAKGGAQ